MERYFIVWHFMAQLLCSILLHILQHDILWYCNFWHCIIGFYEFVGGFLAEPTIVMELLCEPSAIQYNCHQQKLAIHLNEKKVRKKFQQLKKLFRFTIKLLEIIFAHKIRNFTNIHLNKVVYSFVLWLPRLLRFHATQSERTRESFYFFRGNYFSRQLK